MCTGKETRRRGSSVGVDDPEATDITASSETGSGRLQAVSYLISQPSDPNRTAQVHKANAWGALTSHMMGISSVHTKEGRMP